MILFFQIPLADLRPFIEDPGKLEKPDWPMPKPRVTTDDPDLADFAREPQFIRNFGEVTKRTKGGVKGWISENIICNAKHIIRFSEPKLSKEESDIPDFRVANRHFYTDGSALAKLDIVFFSKPQKIIASPQQIKKIVNNIFKIEVKIPTSSAKKLETTKLINSGEFLSKAYLRASSKNEAKNIEIDFWIKSGKPILLLEAGEKEKISLPQNSRKIAVINQPIEMYQWEQVGIQVWLLKRLSDRPEVRQESRLIRIILMRLHSEYEVLNTVLHCLEKGELDFNDEQIQNRKSNQPLQDFQAYLAHSTNNILGLNNNIQKYFGPEKVINTIRELFEDVSPGINDQLRGKLEKYKMRPHVEKSIINHISAKEVTMGDKNINSGSGVLQAGSNNSMQDIHTNQVNNIISNLDIKQLASELELLKKEMEKQATEPEHTLEIGAIAAAEQAAKANNSKKAFELLKSSGKWALDIATKIGTDVAIAAIKASAGM